MDELLDKFRIAIPPHLSTADVRRLYEQLRDFPRADPFEFYAGVTDTEPVQGDAWRGFVAIDFETGARTDVIGLVLSNSCDLAGANEPDDDHRIVFAPLLDLAGYVETLRADGRADDNIDNTVQRIRSQETHRIMYLPPCQSLGGESIILFDDVYSQPLHTFPYRTSERMFSLSNYGFYVFLFKLSVHFTRLTDGVTRESIPAANAGTR